MSIPHSFTDLHSSCACNDLPVSPSYTSTSILYSKFKFVSSRTLYYKAIQTLFLCPPLSYQDKYSSALTNIRLLQGYIERRAGLYYKSLETIGQGKGLLYQYTYYMIINCMRSKLIDSEFVAKEQFEDYIESIYKDLVFLCTNNQIPLVSIIENNTVTACSSHTYSLSSLFALLDRLTDHNIAYLDTCYNLILKIIVKHLYAILGGLKYNPLQVGTYPKFLLYKTQSFLLYLYEHQSQRISSFSIVKRIDTRMENENYYIKMLLPCYYLLFYISSWNERNDEYIYKLLTLLDAPGINRK